MTWVRIDDGFFDNPTNRALGPAGRDLFVAGLTYCAKGLTDGRIAKTDIPLVLAQAQAGKATVRKLTDAGRWIDHGDHYEVSEYLTYNPSRAKVLTDRQAAAERQRSHRESRRDKPRSNGVTPTVTNTVGSASPSRPVPSSTSSSNNLQGLDPPGDAAEAADEDQLWDLLVDRRAELEHPGGHGIRNHDGYRAKLRADHIDRLRPALNELRSKHPDWPPDRLADELDPDSAPVHPHTRALQQAQAEAEQRDAEIAAWLAEQEAATRR